jgi:hypothetical protein
LALLTLAGGMALGSSGMLEAHETKGHEPRRGRAETRLERAGFELVGEPRRKGDFLIVTVTRESLSWRIVVDQRSGEIVGQKLIGHAPPASD